MSSLMWRKFRTNSSPVLGLNNSCEDLRKRAAHLSRGHYQENRSLVLMRMERNWNPCVLSVRVQIV